MTDRELLPCPFCGGGETSVREYRHWTGMRNTVVSVEVQHWCARADGQPQSFLRIAGKTHADAVAAWNHRAAAAMADAGEEG